MSMLRSPGNALLPCLLLVMLCGCATRIPSPDQRFASAQALAATAGWNHKTLHTREFDLTAWLPSSPEPAVVLTVYIEGDGLAWISRTTPSRDPTPIHPTGLQLALQHTPAQAVYLARPCQFSAHLPESRCRSRYWTSQRFAPEVIAATMQAIDQLKLMFNATRIQLVGYSGGGAVAALVAAERSDVARLITVAGNLDIDAWAEEHRVSELRGSLNPAQAWRQLSGIPQLHFVGGRDRIVSRNTAESYVSHFPDNNRPEIRVIEAFSHTCCWTEQWPSLLGGLEPLPAAR